jgi:hypothetical protein
MKKLPLSRGQVSLLHYARAFHPARRVRERALMLLHLARGEPLAKVARAVGCSRPTVYRTLRLWRLYGSVDLLDPKLARKLCPWRADDPPGPTRSASTG